MSDTFTPLVDITYQRKPYSRPPTLSPAGVLCRDISKTPYPEMTNLALLILSGMGRAELSCKAMDELEIRGVNRRVLEQKRRNFGRDLGK